MIATSPVPIVTVGPTRQTSHCRAAGRPKTGAARGCCWSGHGLRLVLQRSKTDQEGETKTLGLPYGSNPATCPVRAWRA